MKTMKKTIYKLLKQEDGNTICIKSLRKQVCKLHPEIESKEERKIAFKEVLNRLEIKGKVVLDKDSTTVTLGWRVTPNAAKVEIAVVQEVQKKEKKRKIKETEEVEVLPVAVEEEVKKKKVKKSAVSSDSPSTDDVNKISAVAVAVTPAVKEVEKEVDASVPPKKEYPPIEVQTGNNTILLFYAYCTPIMSRG